MIKLHTHTHTHNCYKQKIEENIDTNFVRNVNEDIDKNLVKEDEFL